MMFDATNSKKSCPYVAVEWRTIVAFDDLRISVGAEYLVHNLNNWSCCSGTHNFDNGKARILIGYDHEVLT